MVDGDKSLVVADKTLIDVAKRNIEKYDIVPLYYDMKKAEPVHLDNASIYGGLRAAFVGGNIGIYSNNISKIWNSEAFVNGSENEKREAIDLIKLLCMENNYTIDYAKTLYKPTRPKEVNDKVNAFTNQLLPHFFMYAKDKTDSQVAEPNQSFVNMLEPIIPNPRINTRKLGLGEIDCKLMMSNPDIEFDLSFDDRGKLVKEETEPLIVKYCELSRKHYLSIENSLSMGKRDLKQDSKNEKTMNDIKRELSKFGYSESDVSDMLVKFLYGSKKNRNKMALWLCYGDCILRNLERNIRKKTRDIQCVDCGEWFEVSIFDSATERCRDCYCEHRKEYKRIKQKEYRDRLRGQTLEN